jgi:signal peptidase I
MSNSLIEPPFVPAWAKENKEAVFFIFNGTSMAPLLKPGDMLCARRFVFGNIHSGDVVIIDWGNDKNHCEYVVHRVISVKQDYLITQGDNNLNQDTKVVKIENLVGLVTAFGRQNHVHSVRGGFLGFFYARLVFFRNFIWMLIKRIGWQVYSRIRQNGLVARFWRPSISRIHLATENGPLVKYRYRKKTVARWWPQLKRFDVVKPFDLVISNPDESK